MTYLTTVQPVALRGSMLRGLPGAIALLAAVGFGVGVIDEHFRRDLWPVLLVCAGLVAVFGPLALRLHKGADRTLRATDTDDGLRVEVEGLTLVAPSVTRGVFRAFTGRRSYPVAWVALDDGERRVVVRKGLGIHEPTPDWPEGTYALPAVELYGDPLALLRAVR